MLDAWFEKARKKDGIDGGGCRREEIMALKHYLCNEIAVDQASQQIAQSTEDCSIS